MDLQQPLIYILNGALNVGFPTIGTDTTTSTDNAAPRSHRTALTLEEVMLLMDKMDEIAIFNKELSAGQIKFDLYEPSLPCKWS